MNRYCGCIDTDCSVCYELEASYCPDLINIPTGLVAGTPYYLWVRDLHDNLYWDEVTVEADGSVNIVVDNFSHDIFSPSHSPLTIFLSENSDGSGLVEFTIDEVDYTCVNLKINAPVYLVDECENFLTDEDGNYLIYE